MYSLSELLTRVLDQDTVFMKPRVPARRSARDSYKLFRFLQTQLALESVA